MKTVYLAGPIRGLSYEGATTWREHAQEELARYGVKGLSPMRHKENLKGEVILGAEYEDSVMSCAKGITARDRNDVHTCDLMLAYLKGASAASMGTCVEFGWADAWRKPVILVVEPSDLHYHAMLTEIAGFIVETLDEGIHVALAVLDARHSSVLGADDAN